MLTQSAFVSGNHKTSGFQTYTFYYHGPDYSIPNVEDDSDWNTTPPEIVCSGTAKACSVTVDESFVDNPMTAPALKSTLDLDAAHSLARVIGSADSGMSIQNTQQ